MSLKPQINLSNTKRRTKWYYVPRDVIQKEYSTYNVHLSKKKIKLNLTKFLTIMG